MVDPVIETRTLTKRFGHLKAVHELDLSIDESEVYGLLGLNGAGKTTTVRMLAGALPPTSGTAHVMGFDVTMDQASVAHRIGVVFGENITPEPGFSPIRYLRYFGALYGLEKSLVDKRAKSLFERLDLHDDAERPIRELSGGNKRKVEIARALLHKPRLLFLDEPTRELDIPTKRSMWRLFKQFVQKGEVTIVLSSHDVQEIAALCSRIGILREGEKIWEGSPTRLEDDRGGLVEALSDRLEGRGTDFEVVDP